MNAVQSFSSVLDNFADILFRCLLPQIEQKTRPMVRSRPGRTGRRAPSRFFLTTGHGHVEGMWNTILVPAQPLYPALSQKFMHLCIWGNYRQLSSIFAMSDDADSNCLNIHRGCIKDQPRKALLGDNVKPFLMPILRVDG
jgi:hypothetical protein